MSEQTQGQDPTPAGQNPAANNTAPAAQGTGQDPQTFDAAYVKQLRSEAAQWRKQAQEAAAKVQTFEAQQMSETEKLQAQAKAAQDAAALAQTELRKARADAAIAQAAAAQGIAPKLVAKLVDVEFDESGMPVNVDQALAAVLNEYPQLKPGAAGAASGATNPGRGRKLTLEEVKNMTPEQINARWTEVQAVLAGG